jgi:soluble cytochrome b562
MEAKLRQQIEQIITEELEDQINDGCKPFNGIKIYEFITNNNEEINKVINLILIKYAEELKENNNYEFTYDEIIDELDKFIETTDWGELDRVGFERECKVMDDFDKAYHESINKN